MASKETIRTAGMQALGGAGDPAKVLFLAYHFPPEAGVGVFRSLRFARHLPSLGFDPVVVAGPLAKDASPSAMDRSLEAKLPPSVKVHRVPGSAPSAGKWRDRRDRWFLRNTEFTEWWVRSATELALEVGADARLVYATMSPFVSADAASQVAAKLGVSWIADLRDPWVLDERVIYPTIFHRYARARTMAKSLATAALIIMNTPEAARQMRRTFPQLRAIPIVTITNGFDADDFAGPAPERRSSKFTIVHCGGFSTVTALQLQRNPLQRISGGMEKGMNFLTASPRYLAEAIDRFCAASPEMAGKIEVVFAGRCLPEDRQVLEPFRARGLCRFIGTVSHAESIALMRSADLLFLAMHDLPPGKRARMVHAKTYEYMASGRPILAAVPDGDARDVLQGFGNAMLCRPDDVNRMIEVLGAAFRRWEAAEVSNDSKPDYLARFEARALTEALAFQFNQVLRGRRVDEPAISATTRGIPANNRAVAAPETAAHVRRDASSSI